MAGISRYQELRRARRRLIELTNGVIRQIAVIEENDPDGLWDLADELATTIWFWGRQERDLRALSVEEGGEEEELVGHLRAMLLAQAVAGYGQEVLNWLHDMEISHTPQDLRAIVLAVAQLGLTTGAVEECRSIIDRHHLEALAALNGLTDGDNV